MKTRFDHLSTTPIGINILPLLDVVLSILAFFVLASAGLVTPTRLGMTLPRETSNPQKTVPLRSELLIVTLDREGNPRIEGAVVTKAALGTKIKTHFINYPQGMVVLNAEDSQVTYKQFVEFLQELKAIAGERVAIATSRAVEK
ncbi:MAG: biopolymer transporter ExbD [Pseudanabaenaceae cyanobacterium SKYGB_i_bin29]|nr:biopolymer transporter ExbD [Pseudanabaenaceae cyanobacterium SKYG29]MDW8421712.1 biopolymer transporter ExbD [Pseudanabaenaceae cyanobacterium SKYGB_i_bin29]